ncbi:MAG: hypothetical protein ACYSRQ_01800 [Planctomycetota bacterium]|jgi:hypothetical protein
MKEHLRYIVLTGFILLFIPGNSFAPPSEKIFTMGDWDLIIGTGDLQSGPGSDLNSTYTSNSDQTTLRDVNWNSNLHLYIRRTGQGSYTGTPPTNGTSFQEITDTDTYFWEASDTASNVPHQWQLDGVSISIPPDNYETTITFTVIETE